MCRSPLLPIRIETQQTQYFAPQLTDTRIAAMSRISQIDGNIGLDGSVMPPRAPCSRALKQHS